MLDFSAPLRGIQQAEASLNATAQRLAMASAPEGDVVDLSAEMVALMLARNAVRLNAAVLRTEAETSGHLLDVLG